MPTMKFTGDAKHELERLFLKEPDVAEVLDGLLDEIETAPHAVRSQHFRPNATLSSRAVPGLGADAWVIWEWKRGEDLIVVHRLGLRA